MSSRVWSCLGARKCSTLLYCVVTEDVSSYETDNDVPETDSQEKSTSKTGTKKAAKSSETSPKDGPKMKKSSSGKAGSQGSSGKAGSQGSLMMFFGKQK